MCRHRCLRKSKAAEREAAGVSIPFFIKPYRRDQTAEIAKLLCLVETTR
jgi:hypothetical protein